MQIHPRNKLISSRQRPILRIQDLQKRWIAIFSGI